MRLKNKRILVPFIGVAILFAAWVSFESCKGGSRLGRVSPASREAVEKMILVLGEKWVDVLGQACLVNAEYCLVSIRDCSGGRAGSAGERLKVDDIAYEIEDGHVSAVYGHISNSEGAKARVDAAESVIRKAGVPLACPEFPQKEVFEVKVLGNEQSSVVAMVNSSPMGGFLWSVVFVDSDTIDSLSGRKNPEPVPASVRAQDESDRSSLGVDLCGLPIPIHMKHADLGKILATSGVNPSFIMISRLRLDLLPDKTLDVDYLVYTVGRGGYIEDVDGSSTETRTNKNGIATLFAVLRAIGRPVKHVVHGRTEEAISSVSVPGTNVVGRLSVAWDKRWWFSPRGSGRLRFHLTTKKRETDNPD